ncbi:hypothetical protein SDC9_163123 [bioreactor metagenome]|uniref:Uncharacterized protein n=1 Tax=bioreactor metagenome TaxID=1076179 RepID=A0A645FMY6_9ZZZZ
MDGSGGDDYHQRGVGDKYKEYGARGVDQSLFHCDQRVERHYRRLSDLVVCSRHYRKPARRVFDPLKLSRGQEP